MAEGRQGPDAVDVLFSRTKFVPPVPDARIVVRPALQERLAAAVERHPLTLVAAPAGAGKTTALAQWAGAPGRWEPAWVRLDAGDDDATMLGWALLGCLRSLRGDSAYRLEQALTQPGDTSPLRLAHVVANDLAEVPGGVLVLDDAHVLNDPAALSLLDLVLDALHSDNRVVVATRRELALSLPRRRGRGQVGELDFEDLQLDEVTIGQLLARAGDEDAAKSARRIADTTGGWAAAVCLLMPRSGTGSGPVGTSTVDVGAWSRLQQFMLAELLDGQREEVREFLLDTAVLDELTPAACAGVTGRPDVAQLLDRLPEETLLASRIVTRDGQVALRYHDLFAAFLRERLAVERTDEQVRELHRRAAAATPTREAVQHLLDASDLDEAARKVSAIGRSQLVVGTPHLPAAWLLRFDEEIRAAHPWLDLVDGRMHIIRGRIAQARSLLERSLAGMRARGDEEGATRTALALAEASIGVGDLGAAAGVLADINTEDLSVALHANVLLARVWHAFFGLAWTPISAQLKEVCDLVLSAADPAADEVLAFGFGSHLLYADHGPAWLEQRAATLVGRLHPDGPAAASVYATLAGAALLRADLTSAARSLDRAAVISADFGGLGWTDLDIHRMRLGIALARGDHHVIDSLVDEATIRMGEQWHLRQQWTLYAYARARSLWVRGREVEIRGACAPLMALAPPNGGPGEAVSEAVIEALIARADGQPAEAEHLLREAVPLQRAVRLSLVTGDPEVELASLLLAEGRGDEAIVVMGSALERLVELGAAAALVVDGPSHRPLLEFCVEQRVQPRVAADLLSAAGIASPLSPATVPATGEVLTPREREVLRFVADGASNRDIAETLFISERTVKSHMTAILRKLDATSRTRAVALARQQHLV
jgi:LuxR family transcriptional regulator, maltose regulon positive regulatory protein